MSGAPVSRRAFLQTSGAAGLASRSAGAAVSVRAADGHAHPANYWNLGAEGIVLGTGMPFHYPDPALVKIEVLDASPGEKERIRRANAAALLKV
jgi:predicted TIM-barrel fold metal-dependent hydrolase